MNNNTIKIKTGSTRDGFGQGLVKIAQENDQVVGLCADLTESTRMLEFAQKFPDRFFQVGVAEQNLVGISAGLALVGKIPFAASYAAFSPGNSWGVIRSSVCYSNLNVKLVGGHAGLTIGEDGATHQALEDIALMRVLPNMTVIVPADQEEAYQATLALSTHQGPAYLRTSKFETPSISEKISPHPQAFKIGQAITLREGSDISLIACGHMVAISLDVSLLLEAEGISTQVINLHTIKPIDQSMIEKSSKSTKLVVTLEEHQLAGGLGSAVAETNSQLNLLIPHLMIGVEDQFGESGKALDLLKKYKLDQKSIFHKIIERWQKLQLK